MLRLERHALGPRCYVLGRRIHEYQGGLVLLAAALVPALLGLARPAVLVGGVGLWLVAKDWNDLLPSRRDTTSWSLGVHRRLLRLRPRRRGDRLPLLTGAAAGVLGAANLASALTPNVAWRGHALLGLEPVEAVPLFHALALPASVALLVAGVYLVRRRRRAWRAAFAAALALTAFNLLKGLDVEEAALSLTLAGLLWWGREAFHVEHEPLRRSRPGVVALLLAPAALALAAARAVTPASASTADVLRRAADLALGIPSAFHAGPDLAEIPLGVGLVSAACALAAAVLLLRPLRGPSVLPAGSERRAAQAIVRAHGRDTLAFFKLRLDQHYLFSTCGRAFAGYRIEGRVLLVAGDPVGPAEALPGLVEELCRFAERRGLRIGAVGASAALLPLWRDAGLHSLYIGDEAIVETGAFSLEGRRIRKVRQSVHRLDAAGYRTECRTVGELDAATLSELERVAERWRCGAAERGFAMTMDGLAGPHQHDSVIVLARDGDGAVRGFLHFVPSYGRSALSLSFMRRERDTPNGLTEFLVVRAIEELRARGVEELSLNFAAFARLLYAPGGRLERAAGRAVTLGNRYFQIESLYRFNAKFFPRWEPRYVVYEGALGLPRVGLAALWAEGQIPKPLQRSA